MEQKKNEYFRKKMRIALLGEPLQLSHTRVMELCNRFFEYGIEYEKSLNADSSIMDK